METLKKINFTAVLIALLTFILGWQLGQRDIKLQWATYTPSLQIAGRQPTASKDLDFKLFWQTWNLVSNGYVDKKAVDPQKMYYGAIQGMVSSLGDPYTVFLPPESQKSTKEELGGSFEGVGIELGFNKDKRLVVVAPLPGTPAEKAGVKAGDLILKIDDKDTSGLPLTDAVKLIRGPKNTEVILQLFREGDKKPNEVTLTRDTIVVKSVEYQPKSTPSGKKVAYIKLSRFGEKTGKEWEDAVTKTLVLNPSGVVLDLRNNPGGFLDGAVYISSEFISSGTVVTQEDGEGNKQEYPVNRQGKLTKIPLVVLINKGSASASEIVAGAIQDYERGVLVGEQSFGKGTIQESQDLPEGTGIHITKAKWLTPKGNWVHNIGLTPNIKIDSVVEEGKDPQLNKALDLLD